MQWAARQGDQTFPVALLWNHPITDVPCFAIHPCNTADALVDIIGAKDVSGLDYLQIWIGLIGGPVGLYLPKELAMECEARKLGIPV